MKRAIEWVDTVNGFGQVLPSELLRLVEEVRAEALDTVELDLRKHFKNDLPPHLVEVMRTWRQQ